MKAAADSGVALLRQQPLKTVQTPPEIWISPPTSPWIVRKIQLPFRGIFQHAHPRRVLRPEFDSVGDSRLGSDRSGLTIDKHNLQYPDGGNHPPASEPNHRDARTDPHSSPG